MIKSKRQVQQLQTPHHQLQQPQQQQLNVRELVMKLKDQLNKQDILYNTFYCRVINILQTQRDDKDKKMVGPMKKCKNAFVDVKDTIKKLEMKLNETETDNNKVNELQKQIQTLSHSKEAIESNYMKMLNHKKQIEITSGDRFHIQSCVNKEFIKIQNEKAQLEQFNNAYIKENQMLKQKVGEYKLEIVMLNNKLNNNNKSNQENSTNVHSYTKQSQTKQDNNIIINDKSNLSLRKFDSYNIRSNYNKTFDAVAKAQPIIKKDEQQQPVKFIKFINVNSNNNNNDARRNQNNVNTSNFYNKRMKETTNNEQVSEVEMSFSSKYPNNLFLFDMS